MIDKLFDCTTQLILNYSLATDMGMEKVEYFFASLLLLIVATFVGWVIFLFVQLCSGKTSNPSAEIRFDLEQNDKAIEFNDFTCYPAFKNAQCDNCNLSINSSVPVAAFLEGRELSVYLFSGKGKILRILFYGEDKEKINSMVMSLSNHLRESEKFKKGFEVCAEAACDN